MYASGTVLERRGLGTVGLPLNPDKDPDKDLERLDCLETRIRDQQSTARPIDTGLAMDSTSVKDSQRGSSLGSVFFLSSHWVRRFFIDPSAGFSFPTLVKVGRFFHRQYQ